MEIHLKVIGVVLIGLASVHVIFPRYFNWQEELKDLSLINRQMMQVHTFFIAFTVLLMGLLCLTLPHELANSFLGKKLLLGLGAFWGIRLFVQLFVYSSKLWKGKRLETGVHILFVLLWTYLAVIFFTISLS